MYKVTPSSSPFSRAALALAGLVAGVALGCTPEDEQGQCVEDADCTSRGQVCQTTTSVCEERPADYSTTAEPSPATGNFTNKVIPFFRGRVCTAPGGQILAGAPIPVSLQPCIHPCLTPTSYRVQHDWKCEAASCQARTYFWVVADGNACPEEAWTDFDPSICQYPTFENGNPVESSLGTVELDGQPLEAGMQYEIPFFTNIDIANVAAYSDLGRDGLVSGASSSCLEACDGSSTYESCLKNCFAKETAFQYTQQQDRVFGINLANTNPTPPPNCSDDPSACECFDIGF